MPRALIYVGLSAALHVAAAALLIARPLTPRRTSTPLQIAVVDRAPPAPPPTPAVPPPRPAPPPPQPKKRLVRPPPRPRWRLPTLRPSRRSPAESRPTA